MDRHVHHALMNDRVTSGLTDDEISPLNDHDRHKERRVTRVLQRLPLSVRLHTDNMTTTIHVHSCLPETNSQPETSVSSCGILRQSLGSVQDVGLFDVADRLRAALADGSSCSVGSTLQRRTINARHRPF